MLSHKFPHPLLLSTMQCSPDNNQDGIQSDISRSADGGDDWAFLKRRRNKRKSKKYIVKDVDEWDLINAVEVVEERREALRNSQFHDDFQSMKTKPIMCLSSLGITSGFAFSQPYSHTGILQKHLIPLYPYDIVCYGVGSMHHSRNAQFQFALMLLIREALQHCLYAYDQVRGKVYMYDPVMTQIDRELLGHYGVELILENEVVFFFCLNHLPISQQQAKRVVSEVTLFYMPHCCKRLYSNLMSANWNPDALEKVVVLGNRFGLYVESQTDSELRRKAPYLIPAASLTTSTPLPPEFDDNKIFNDLCVHVFERRRLRAMGDGFWTVDLEVVEGLEWDAEVL
ncbi:hypothetical protein BC937DRAFT_91178 [Endogone sp. FLAS-F59071]|nr:hypothetical protein BC937DRAFT_91178 [Endogone sp. FLAS-F59071]|eukprot:RUS16457.1 hypothetical protein BC937DRAFT_91178 [Endogone sp. FLAS-F59071]